MIDLLSIDIDKAHTPFGNKNLKKNAKTGITTSKQLSDKVALYPGANCIFVTSMDNGTRINIRCNPLKPLQGHNVFGTDNVIGLGHKLIQFVLAKLGITASAEELQGWEQGKYKLREIHVTYHLKLPSHAQLKPLVTHILRTIHTKYRPAFIKTGVGITLQSPTSHAEWMLYDKFQYLQDKRHKEYDQLLALVGDPTIADGIWQCLLEESTSTLRVELRLSERYLKAMDLDEPAKWRKGKAREIFLKELGLLRFWRVPAMREIPPLLEKLRVDKPLLRIFQLWSIGDDLGDYFSPGTVRAHGCAIKKLTGIDIALDTLKEESKFDLVSLFIAGNIIPKHPIWIERFPSAFYRGGALEDVRQAACC